MLGSSMDSCALTGYGYNAIRAAAIGLQCAGERY